MHTSTFLIDSFWWGVTTLVMSLIVGAPLIFKRFRHAMQNNTGRRAVLIIVGGLLIGVLAYWWNLAGTQINSIFLPLMTTDHYDYSQLPQEAQNCKYDAVTCAYIDKNPPTGIYDGRPMENSIASVLDPLLGALFGVAFLARITQKPMILPARKFA